MVNRVTLIGHLGKDPATTRLENGAAVAKFTLATTENYKDANGEWQKQTEWHEVVAWREKAEQVESTLKKGMLVYVEGKLTHRKYTDQNNIERYRTEVVANYLRLLKIPDGGQGGNYFPSATNEPAYSGSKNDNPVEPVMADVGEAPPAGADDLPF
jgi:single-strand DNA-binding protein